MLILYVKCEPWKSAKKIYLYYSLRLRILHFSFAYMLTHTLRKVLLLFFLRGESMFDSLAFEVMVLRANFIRLNVRALFLVLLLAFRFSAKGRP